MQDKVFISIETTGINTSANTIIDKLKRKKLN